MNAYHPFLLGVSFHEFLHRCDARIAARTRDAGCSRCGGILDSARYRRKPRGLEVPEELRRRFSFTCRSCDRRTTPPSLLFLGRKVYFGSWVLLSIVLTQGKSAWSIGRVCRTFTLSRRTWRRWRGFWQADLPLTPFWRKARAAFMPPLRERELPLSMLERFTGTPRTRVRLALAFVAPSSSKAATASRAS